MGIIVVDLLLNSFEIQLVQVALVEFVGRLTPLLVTIVEGMQPQFVLPEINRPLRNSIRHFIAPNEGLGL